MDDGNRVSADAPFWWTSLPQLHTFTLSRGDALWLKGVREGALAVARTPWSDAAGRRTAQLGECQNYFVTMGIQNPDNSCSAYSGAPTPADPLGGLSLHVASTMGDGVDFGSHQTRHAHGYDRNTQRDTHEALHITHAACTLQQHKQSYDLLPKL